MRNFQNTFKTRKRSFFSAFSICMTVPLIKMNFHVRQVVNKMSLDLIRDELKDLKKSEKILISKRILLIEI